MACHACQRGLLRMEPAPWSSTRAASPSDNTAPAFSSEWPGSSTPYRTPRGASRLASRGRAAIPGCSSARRRAGSGGVRGRSSVGSSLVLNALGLRATPPSPLESMKFSPLRSRTIRFASVASAARSSASSRSTLDASRSPATATTYRSAWRLVSTASGRYAPVNEWCLPWSHQPPPRLVVGARLVEELAVDANGNVSAGDGLLTRCARTLTACGGRGKNGPEPVEGHCADSFGLGIAHPDPSTVTCPSPRSPPRCSRTTPAPHTGVAGGDRSKAGKALLRLEHEHLHGEVGVDVVLAHEGRSPCDRAVPRRPRPGRRASPAGTRSGDPGPARIGRWRPACARPG